MNNKLQYVDDLQALTDEFNTFINEPLGRDENYHVRDYRHAAYQKWVKIDRGIDDLIDRLRKAEAAPGSDEQCGTGAMCCCDAKAKASSPVAAQTPAEEQPVVQMGAESIYLAKLNSRLLKSDGTYDWPDGAIGNLLQQAKLEIDAYQVIQAGRTWRAWMDEAEQKAPSTAGDCAAVPNGSLMGNIERALLAAPDSTPTDNADSEGAKG